MEPKTGTYLSINWNLDYTYPLSQKTNYGKLAYDTERDHGCKAREEKYKHLNFNQGSSI